MTPQATIAHYRITSKLGEGGMGAVYRATDTKLGREVAIKVLPDSFAGDPDRLARFTREAQVLASLNHPNIAAIYGVEERALVMELVEGGAPAGPMSVEETLPIVHQLVEALEYAHEKGIVHRDLKPANLKLTPDGRLKVLDFGLAKALSQDAESAASQPADSPTLTMRATMAGVIMGTAAYMSPEQARGHAVDKRAGIWSFGVVLYELLTGKQLFAGDTVSDTLAAVLRQAPDLTAVPPRFRKVLGLCLTRDPRQRLRDISGVRLLLDETPAAAPASRRHWPWMAAVGATAAIAAVGWWPRPAQPPAIQSRFEVTLPEGTLHSGNSAAPQIAPSPDGRHLAFVARDEKDGKSWLWVRPVNSWTSRRIERTEEANFPFWSPDSQHIGFFTETKLKRVSLAGGAPQTICNIDGRGNGAAWNEAGTIVFAAGFASLLSVPAAGGEPAPATVLEKAGEEYHGWPQFLPGGRRVLYYAGRVDGGQGAIYAQDLGSTSRTRVMATLSRAVYAEGYLLFTREETLMAQRFDPDSLRLDGEPAPLADGMAENSTSGRSPFAAVPGVLATRHGGAVYAHRLTWRDPAGKAIGTVGEVIEMHGVAVSPDRKRAAIIRHDNQYQDDVWLMDLATGVLMRGATSKARYTTPVWSPDSERLAVGRRGEGIAIVHLATGREVALPGTSTLVVDDWTPDGQHLLVGSADGKTVSLVPADPGSSDPKAKTLLETVSRTGYLQIAPDGRRVCFLSNESGANELYVADFPSFGAKRRLSTGGAMFPRWAPDSRSIVFYSTASFYRVDIAQGTPREIFRPGVTMAALDVASDGRLLVPERPATRLDDTFAVVLNWTAGLKR
jgi:serine/threonine protein kinase